MNRIITEIIYLLIVKYKILYKIGISNKLIELGFIIRFINSLKRYSILSSRLLNILIILICLYIFSISSIKLIDFIYIISIR